MNGLKQRLYALRRAIWRWRNGVPRLSRHVAPPGRSR